MICKQGFWSERSGNTSPTGIRGTERTADHVTGKRREGGTEGRRDRGMEGQRDVGTEGCRAWNKRQRQEIEDEGEGEEKEYLSLGDKGLPLEREETNLAHRRRAVYKGKRRGPVLG